MTVAGLAINEERRDIFAVAALTGILARKDYCDPEQYHEEALDCLADECYLIAEAMLKRSKL